MAKDGTNRGGKRPGAGRKKKSAIEKIEAGQDVSLILPEPADLSGVETPPVKEYLKANQRCGIDLSAEEVFNDTYQWLAARGCEKLVGQQLIEQYAMSVARYIQCETAISQYGFLAKHPTTQNAMQSPYVAMSQNYMKQANQLWFQIFQVVKENCTESWSGGTPQDNVMELLLRKKG